VITIVTVASVIAGVVWTIIYVNINAAGIGKASTDNPI